MENFLQGMIAVSNDLGISFSILIHNELFLGFAGGTLLAILLVGYILTEDPKHIPVILRYSAIDSFQKIAERDTNGTYKMAFSEFSRMYFITRILYISAFVAFCVMISIVLLTQK